MKSKLILLLALIIPFFVYADLGRTFELDFKAKDQYNLLLNKSDRVLFEYGGYNNTIIIDDIKANTTEIDIFLFLEKGPHNPDYQFLGEGYDLRLDFDKDGKKEMSIRLVKNDLKEGMTHILFKKLDAWDENAVLDLSNWNVENEKAKPNLFLYFVGIITIIIFLLIILSIYYYSKRRGIYF